MNNLDKELEDKIIQLWKSGKKSIFQIAVDLNTGIPNVTNTLSKNKLFGFKKK